MKKILLSILLTFTLTFTFSQTVVKSGGHSAQENKTTKVILNAVNGSVEIHKHVLDGTSFGYGSGSTWNDDIGYISTRTTTTVNSSTTEYLCDTPAELTVDKPVKLSIGGNDAWSFTINPTGGTQYWDVKAGNGNKFLWGFVTFFISVFPLSFSVIDILEGIDNYYFPTWGVISGVTSIGLVVTGSVLLVKASPKITLIKIEY